jgi:hypothetical protein
MSLCKEPIYKWRIDQRCNLAIDIQYLNLKKGDTIEV